MKKYTKFLFSLAKIGCIGFGGGSALIPVIEEEVIKKQKLDTKENLDTDVIVASITPGALPVEIAASLGKRNFGKKGMVMGAIAMALPGTLITILMLTILSTVQTGFLQMVELISVGVSAFIIYLLISYIRNMLRDCRKESKVRAKKAIFMMTVCFLMVCEKNIYKILGIQMTPIMSLSTVNVLLLSFFGIFYSRGRYHVKNVAVIIILGLIYILSNGKAGLIENVYLKRATEILMFALSIWGVALDIRESNWKYEKIGKEIYKDVGIWIILLLLAGIPAIWIHRDAIIFMEKGLLSAVMSFGGGDAYLTIADGLFVESKMVTEHQYFSQIVSVVNVLPGSILCKTLSGVGYYVGWNLSGSVLGGLLFALAGFAVSVSASCGFFITIFHLYSNLMSLYVFQMISRWIRPIIAGLLVNIMLALCSQSMQAAELFQISGWVALVIIFVLVALDMILAKKTKLGTVVILLLNIAAVIGVISFL